MQNQLTIAITVLLVPLAFIIAYYDVLYRRIPNAFVLAGLAGGLIINTLFGGWQGFLSSVGGCFLAFGVMLLLHIVGAMGAGDVKLFAAVGSIVGLNFVMPTFIVVLMTGGALAIVTMCQTGTFATTMRRVLQIFMGLLPGWKMPRFAVPTDKRYTIPYGVAITLGSLISLMVFRA